MPDEIAGLAKAFSGLGTEWKVTESRVVLDFRGPACVFPICSFRVAAKRSTSKCWASGVAKRCSAASTSFGAGSPREILFAVSSRLRVSEEVLEEDASGALYVYKGAMSARAVAERLESLARGGALG